MSKTNKDKDPETYSSENVKLKSNSFFDDPEDYLDSAWRFLSTFLFELEF